MKRAALLAFSSFLLAAAVRADTNVSGNISTNTTWTLANSPYVVTGSVYVEGSGTPTLTIEAGVTVKLNSGTQLALNYNYPGALQALGTEASPILFTANGSTSPGFWLGLYFGNQAATNATQVSYATVEYGGVTAYSRGGIHVESSSPTFDHVTVRNSVYAGISVNGGSPAIAGSTVKGNSGPGVRVGLGYPSLGSSTITNNTGYAVSVGASGSVSGLGGLTVSGNGPGKDLIERRGGTIAASQTWALAAIPYVITGDIFEESGTTPVLSIQAGVTVKFNSATQLVFNYNAPGALQAVGTAASPILFTADGSTSPRFWYGLYFGNKAATNGSQISYVTVEYGGITGHNRGVAFNWASAYGPVAVSTLHVSGPARLRSTASPRGMP